MAVDRYTKLVLTVIAVCLVWLSVGGPSLLTPVSAQQGDRVFLAGWIDDEGRVISFPQAPHILLDARPPIGNQPNPTKPRTTSPLPIMETAVPYR
jgi:hypothetical protein